MPKHNQTPLNRFRKDFRERTKPEFKEPVLPASISMIKSEVLSDWQTKYGAWREYTEDVLIDAFADLLKAQEEYDYAYDKLFIVIDGSTNVAKERKVNVDSRIRKLKLLLDEADLYHTLLTKRKESYDNVLTLISREITRRGSEGAYK